MPEAAQGTASGRVESGALEVVKEKGYEKWQTGEMKLLRKEENCLRISVRSGKQEEETVYTWKIMR